MDLSDNVADRLYAAAPEDFLSVRAALAAEAKAAGDADLSRTVTAVRKPTVAAWIVNRAALEDPALVGRLHDLGDALRAAQADLDAARLRELSTERRRVVAELTDRALDGAGRADAPTALRDDVQGTFDAAVADPSVAARLGRLTRPQRWSGFGLADDTDDGVGTPDLTVIRGGRTPARAPARPAVTTTTGHDRPAAPPRGARRARDRARQVLDDAEAALEAAERDQQHAADLVRELSARLADLQRDLETAQADAERLRTQAKAARTRRREARSALDRAERRLEPPS